MYGVKAETRAKGSNKMMGTGGFLFGGNSDRIPGDGEDRRGEGDGQDRYRDGEKN